MMDDDVNVYRNTEQKRLGEEVDSRDSWSAHDSILQELLGDAATSPWCLGELGQYATKICRARVQSATRSDARRCGRLGQLTPGAIFGVLWRFGSVCRCRRICFNQTAAATVRI